MPYPSPGPARTRFGAAARLVAIALLPALGACQLVDQTTFDPVLRARIHPAPKPVPAPMVARTGPPALLTIRFDHAPDYDAALRSAVGLALARKPDVQFDVVTVVPDTGGIDSQIAAVKAHGGDARRVASDILADGVEAGQVALGARAEPGVIGHEVRVYVR